MILYTSTSRWNFVFQALWPLKPSALHRCMMHVLMMQTSMMHVFMIDISMTYILYIHDVCIADACIYDAESFGHTDKRILGLGCEMQYIYIVW